MKAHCLDPCNIYFSARCRHYTKYVIKKALAAHQASSIEADRAEIAKLRAEIAKKRAAANPPVDDEDDEDDEDDFGDL